MAKQQQQQKQRGRITVTRGMAGAAVRGRTAARRCKRCGLAMGRYPGRYPVVCPTCGGDIEIVESSPIISCVSMVPRLQRVLDASVRSAPRGPWSSHTFIAGYEEVSRVLPGGLDRLTSFMEEGPHGRYFRVESTGEPVIILELDDTLRRVNFFSTMEPARYLGHDPRVEFVDCAPVLDEAEVPKGAVVVEWDGNTMQAFRFFVMRGGRKVEVGQSTVFRRQRMVYDEKYENGMVAPDLTWRTLMHDPTTRAGLVWGYLEGIGHGELHGAPVVVVGPKGASRTLGESLDERGGPWGAAAYAPSWDHNATIGRKDGMPISPSVADKRRLGEKGRSQGPTSNYGGFRIHVGARQTRRPRKDVEQALQNKRNQRRGLGKRIQAAKEWHRSPDGERFHDALGRYNERPSGSGGRRRQQARMAESSACPLGSRCTGALKDEHTGREVGPGALVSFRGFGGRRLRGTVTNTSGKSFCWGCKRHPMLVSDSDGDMYSPTNVKVLRWAAESRVVRSRGELFEAATQYAETIDDVLDGLLRKLLVIEALDILQDVEFDEETGSIYLFFDPTVSHDEMAEVVRVLQSEQKDIGLIASPDRSLEGEMASSDWWVVFLPRMQQEGAPQAQPDPGVYASGDEEAPGPQMRQPIVVPARASSAETIADEIDIDGMLGELGGGTAESIRRLPARLQERLAVLMRARR